MPTSLNSHRRGSAPRSAQHPNKAGEATNVQLWIRRKGSRRQAFFRLNEADQWQDLQVTHADRALRTGVLKVGDTTFPVVVSRETPAEPEHPAAEAFRTQAAQLNQAINAINGSAWGLA